MYLPDPCATGSTSYGCRLFPSTSFRPSAKRGIDRRLELDQLRMARNGQLDVAIVFSAG